MESELLTKIAEQGLLGVLLVASFLTIFFLYKEVRKERDARLADMKEVWKEDVTFRAELKTIIQSILDILREGAK